MIGWLTANWGGVITIIGILVALAVLAEWRLWRNREALRGWEQIEHQRVIDEIKAAMDRSIEAAFAVSDREKREAGQAFDALSSLVYVHDDWMEEIGRKLDVPRPARKVLPAFILPAPEPTGDPKP